MKWAIFLSVFDKAGTSLESVRRIYVMKELSRRAIQEILYGLATAQREILMSSSMYAIVSFELDLFRT
jgi:hypothetical protein